MKPEELIAHVDFVHSLARTLVMDQNQAADIEQTTFLAALENPPTADRSIRGWFSRVMKNFVVSTYRKETTRKKYEDQTQTAQSVTTPEDIAIRKEALQKMTDAVFNLEEPYFSVILLRFYEDMSAKQVAERLNVPLETVKTRIQRGLNLLRKKLDEDHGGSRKKWCLALAPIAGLDLATAAEAAAAAGTTASGSLFAAAWVKLTLAALLILGSSLTYISVTSDPKKDPEPSVAALDQEKEKNSPPELSSTSSKKEKNTLIEKDPNKKRDPIAPSGIFIEGFVTNKKTGDPITAYDFQLEWRLGYGRRDRVIHETVRNESGRFYYPLKRTGRAELRIRAKDYCWKDVIKLNIRKTNKVLNLTLNPGITVMGRVVDHKTDLPVQGVRVVPWAESWMLDCVREKELGYEQVLIHAKTDRFGFFVLKGLNTRPTMIAAIHPDYAEEALRIYPENKGRLNIRLKKGARIFGVAKDDDGQPAKGIMIRIHGNEMPLTRTLLTGPDGSFLTPPVRPGRVFILATRATGELKGSRNFTDERKVVDMLDQDVEVNFGNPWEHVTWTGVVYGYDGKPKPYSHIYVFPAQYDYETNLRFEMTSMVRSNRSGRFEIKKLIPDRYKVAVGLPFEYPKEWRVLTLNKTGEFKQDIDLTSTASISGLVLHRITRLPFSDKEGYVRAYPVDRDSKLAYYIADIKDNGAYTLKGLPPGVYKLAADVDGLQPKALEGVKVAKGQKLQNADILMSPCGRLRIKAIGFDKSVKNQLFLYIAGGLRHRDYCYGQFATNDQGVFSKEFTLEAGNWVVSLSFKEMGYVQREVEVSDDRLTELVILRNEITLGANDILVSGRIAYPDGRPLKNTTIGFRADSAPGLKREFWEKKTSTDNEGFYTMENLAPGRWTVGAFLDSGSTVTFERLRIPLDSPKRIQFDQVIYGNSISGALFSQDSRLAFKPGAPRQWRIFLHDVEQDRYISRLWSENSKDYSRFDLHGVPPGRYQLIIRAEGFEEYNTGAFDMTSDQQLDFERIFLTPCGLLDLEVLDQSLIPLDHYRVYCDGARVRSTFGKDNILRFDKLPVGQAMFTIKKKGYKDYFTTITLDPSFPVKIRVIMKSL